MTPPCTAKAGKQNPVENVGSSREIAGTDNIDKATGHTGGFHYHVQPLVSVTGTGRGKI